MNILYLKGILWWLLIHHPFYEREMKVCEILIFNQTFDFL